MTYIDKELFSEAFAPVVFNPNECINLINVKLRSGGRKAPKGGADMLTIDGLKSYYLKKYKGYADYLDDVDEVRDIILLLIEFSEKMFSDIKYNFDTENLIVIDHIFTTSTSVNYLICFGGGDWQLPAVFFFYWDGKQYRIYVPFKGNAINPINKSMFGEDAGFDAEFEANSNIVMGAVPVNIPACIEDFEARLEVF